MGLPDHKQAVIKTVVFEDNRGCHILANSPPGRTTPDSKHFAVKYHWFREQLIPGEIIIAPIDTARQLADIFTKGLRRLGFEKNRSDLCGWVASAHLECLKWRHNFF